MAYVLPELPYALDALAPHISSKTLDFHYNKHHKGYVTKLNALVTEGNPLFGKPLEEIVKGSDGGVFNNAAQIWNHTFYWNSMTGKGGGGPPTGAIKDAIEKDFTSFDKFKAEFTNAATTHFGSGWAWLVKDSSNKLKVISTHDAGCPIKDGLKPILVCDVWEHAYYLDYQNLRPSYVEAWFNLVNWEWANKQLA